MGSGADQIISLYRRHAHAWAKRRDVQLSRHKWFDKFMEFMPQAPSVLDLGCGSGKPVGRYLLDCGCAVTGIDTSSELIDFAIRQVPGGTWIVGDMRALNLDRKFQGVLAWNSTFHLKPEDQRKMFPVFERHAAGGCMLLFTSGPGEGEVMGTFEGEALYHASLDAGEYRTLLDQHGFDVIDHVVEDPDCGGQTIWLARYRASD